MMDAITALQNRVSAPRVSDKLPDEATLDAICRCALRAADHGLIRPWRFLIIRGESRQRLGDLFIKASLQDSADLSAPELEKIRSKALRAPLIIVGITSPKAHPKVPLLEQQQSTAAALQNIINAAFALNVGAIWRTGGMATHAIVREGLGLSPEEEITGFIYLGEVDGPLRPLKPEDPSLYFQEW